MMSWRAACRILHSLPLALVGTGVETAVSNAKVHIHPGNIGDSDAAGGISDLDSSSHRWLNPVATITIVGEVRGMYES